MYEYNPVIYTKSMKETHTILFPNMCDPAFRFFKPIFAKFGYRSELLPDDDPTAMSEALKYSNPDMCVPAHLVIGQCLLALKSGKYDASKVAFAMTQTCGGCRDSNYVNMMRKALATAGYGHVPVVAIGLIPEKAEKNGFKLSLGMLIKMVKAIIIGDVLMICRNRVKPYEATSGETEKLYEFWSLRIEKRIANMSLSKYHKTIHKIVEDFGRVELKDDRMKPRVGIVGEIYLKYNHAANMNLVCKIEAADCEAVLTPLMDFFMCFFTNAPIYHENGIENGPSAWVKAQTMHLIIWLVEKFFRKPMVEAMKNSDLFETPSSIWEIADHAEGIIQRCNLMGEGYLLTGEMIELMHQGVSNILCAQPFGCLPNHVVARGVIRAIRETHGDVNIFVGDYEQGTTPALLEGRLDVVFAKAWRDFNERRSC